MTSEALLTDEELEALEFISQASRLMKRVIGDGPNAKHDWEEMTYRVHSLQHVIMAQAAARAYPDEFRLLGQEGAWTKVDA